MHLHAKVKGVNPEYKIRLGYISKLLPRHWHQDIFGDLWQKAPNGSMEHHLMVNEWHQLARQLLVWGNLHIHQVCCIPFAPLGIRFGGPER